MSAVAENSPESPSQSPPPANAAIASPSASASATADGENNTPSAPFALPPGMPMPASLAGMQFVPYFPPMASSGDPADPNAQPQPQMMIHPAFLSQIQMYPYPYPGMLAHGLKLKRKQVKNACTNCQKACKKCDDERPCPRCVKYGIAEECQDSIRKERRKGIKRGSYKKKCKSFVIQVSIYLKLNTIVSSDGWWRRRRFSTCFHVFVSRAIVFSMGRRCNERRGCYRGETWRK